MQRSRVVFLLMGSPLLFAGQCDGGPGGGLDCDPNEEDCGNFDKRIDGQGEGEVFDSHSVRMCDPGNGQLYAVWVDDRRELFDVWFNKSEDGGRNWLPQPIQVKQGGGSASNPSVACNADRIYVVWEDTRDSDVDYTNIYINFSNDGGDTWRNNDRLVNTFDRDGRQISLAPRVAFRGPNTHVVWADQISGAPDIYAASSPDAGNNWLPPVRLSGLKFPPAEGGGLDPNEAGESWSGNPQIAIGANGRVHVVWEDALFGGVEGAGDEGAQDILYASSTDNTGQTWNDWVRVSRGVPFGRNFSFHPRIGVDEREVHIVWSDDRNGALDLFLLHSENGGNSFPNQPSRIAVGDQDGEGEWTSAFPELVVDGPDAHVVWQNDQNGGFDIFAAVVRAGEVLGAATRLNGGDQPGRSNSLRPVISLGEDAIVAGWRDRRVDLDQGFNELHYNHSERGASTWATGADWRLDSVLGGTSFSEDLNLATFGGEVYAAWTDFRSGGDNPDIRFSHTPLGQAVTTADDFQD